MTSYIIYPNFEWECENSQLEIFERVLESNYSKAINSTGIERVFDNTIKELNKNWLNFIKFINKKFKILMKKIEKTIKNIKNIDLKIDIDVPFVNLSFVPTYKKYKLTKVRNINDFYDKLLDTIHYIIIYMKKSYQREINNLNTFKNNVLNNKQPMIVNESEIRYYDFPGEIISLEGNFIGEDILNQLFIEKCQIFNNIDVTKIMNASKYQLDVLQSFSNTIIRRLEVLVNKNSDYYKCNKEFVDNGFTTNILINEFIRIHESDNGSIEDSINLYQDLVIKDVEQLQYYLGLIILKSQVIIEAITNIFKYNILSTYIGEKEIESSILNIKSSDLSKIKDIYNLNKNIIEKHNGRFLDFSKFKLGSVCLLEDSSTYESLIKRYLDFNFSSILLYYIGKYDFSIISHGDIESFKDLSHFIRVYRGYYPVEYNLFKKCYKEEIQFYSDIINKDFDLIEESDAKYIENYLENNEYSDILESYNLSSKNIIDFQYSYKRRWQCDPVFIPQVNSLMIDVEMIIYIMNINEIKKLNINICNYNYNINKKAISTFDNMTVWYSPELLIK